MSIRVDGEVIALPASATILEACAAVGRYIPRLCYYPELGCAACGPAGTDEARAGRECGLCVVTLGDGSMVLACKAPAVAGMDVTTDSPDLRSLRLGRLAAVLEGHPTVCLACPDAEGCNRDECTYGNPPETRCCEEFGRCELGKLIAWMDPAVSMRRPVVARSREAETEGRIRREAGLCIGCGRCVRACSTLAGAGEALEMYVGGDGRVVARPKSGTLRASGCTFCGQCVVVCPAGALTAPGERGTTWLAGRREKSSLGDRVLPPVSLRPFTVAAVALVTAEAGVFRLFDRQRQTLLIEGVADLRRALKDALDDPAAADAAYFDVELEQMFTQRESELLARHVQEHGHLPGGNDLDDDLF